MSQGWANSTLGLEWAKFSELSVHHSTVTPAVGTVTSAQCRRGLSALCPSAPLRLPMELVPTRTCFSTGARNATCPQGQADLLGFFFFLFSPHILWLAAGWERSGELLSISLSLSTIASPGLIFI